MKANGIFQPEQPAPPDEIANLVYGLAFGFWDLLWFGLSDFWGFGLVEFGGWG